MKMLPLLALLVGCAELPVDEAAPLDVSSLPADQLGIPNVTTGTLTCGGQPVGQGCSVRLEFYDVNGVYATGGAMTDPSGFFSTVVTCAGHVDGGEYWVVTSDCCDEPLTIPTNGCSGDLGELECCPVDQGCVEPPPNMVAWWPFDETAPNIAEDTAGLVANDGTWVNGPVPVPGVVDGALAFDGANDFVKVPDDNEIDFFGGAPISRSAEDLSIDAWIQVPPGGANGVKVILDKRQKINNKPRGYNVFLYNGQLGFQMADAIGTTAVCGTGPNNACTNWVAGPNLADGRWHLIAITVERAPFASAAPYGRFYVDGAQVGTFTPRNGRMDNNQPLLIGQRAIQMGGGGFYRGFLDELEIFKRALTPAEVQALWEAGPEGKCKEDEEICDGIDNNGDGQIDEGYPDTDGDGIADCVDRETCDGLDNNGDGQIDEGYPDTDGDGIADCIDRETCDGIDNNGDGQIDEGYPDTDGDGIADCVDREECDCLDNDGDGQIDEPGGPYDTDGDGVPDSDICLYKTEITLSADDTFRAWMDNAANFIGSDPDTNWATPWSTTLMLPYGGHLLSVEAGDAFGAYAGFIGNVQVNGVNHPTGTFGNWTESFVAPPAGWQNAVQPWGADTTVLPDPTCSPALAAWGGAPLLAPLYGAGAEWVWQRQCIAQWPRNWFQLRFHTCPRASVADPIDCAADPTLPTCR